MGIKHKFASAKSNGSDASRVQPSNWNDDHDVTDIVLPKNTTPTVPAADNVTLFGRNVGGRMMPAFMGPSGLDTSIQPFLGRNSWANWAATGNSTTIAVSGAAAALTATGTATAANMAITTAHTRMKRIEHLVTTAATTAVAGWRGGVAIYCRQIGYQMVLRGGPATGQATTATTGRFWMGLAATTSAPTDVAPSTQINCIGIGFEGTDTNLFLYHNDASGACIRVSLGTDFPRYITDRATMYELALFCPPNGAYVRYEVTDLATGKVSAGQIDSVDQPIPATFLAPRCWASVGGTSSVIGTAFTSLYIETDY